MRPGVFFEWAAGAFASLGLLSLICHLCPFRRWWESEIRKMMGEGDRNKGREERRDADRRVDESERWTCLDVDSIHPSDFFPISSRVTVIKTDILSLSTQLIDLFSAEDRCVAGVGGNRYDSEVYMLWAQMPEISNGSKARVESGLAQVYTILIYTMHLSI
jgi:hypothetical protein